MERVSGVRAIANEVQVEPTKAFTHGDVEIAEAVVRALQWCSSLPRERVKAQVESGWVTLEGKLDWQFQKEAAEESLRHLAGIRGISNQITVEPAVKAAEVKDKIAAALSRSAALHPQQITVEARDRRVTLHGMVHSWSERREAEHAAWAAPGVAAVENELAVAP